MRYPEALAENTLISERDRSLGRLDQIAADRGTPGLDEERADAIVKRLGDNVVVLGVLAEVLQSPDAPGVSKQTAIEVAARLQR